MVRRNKKMLSCDDVTRMNKITIMRKKQREMGIDDVIIAIPKSHKIVGVGICGMSFVTIGCDVATVPMGIAVMMSPNKRDIIPTYKRLFGNNIKKMVGVGKTMCGIIKYKKNGVRRWA